MAKIFKKENVGNVVKTRVKIGFEGIKFRLSQDAVGKPSVSHNKGKRGFKRRTAIP